MLITMAVGAMQKSDGMGDPRGRKRNRGEKDRGSVNTDSSSSVVVTVVVVMAGDVVPQVVLTSVVVVVAEAAAVLGGLPPVFRA